jgi:TetR/AcrR family transcriptional repressor of nem operon
VVVSPGARLYTSLRSTTFAAALGGGAQATDRATAIFTAIVGAVSLARAVGKEAIAARILADVRALVLR